MKKLLTIAIAAAMLLAIPALAIAPEAYRAEYEGNGRVEIDFRNNVTYENPTVQVAPADFLSEAPALTARILELDNDDLTFVVEGILPETTYNYTVSGVREGRTGDFVSITGAVTTPAECAVVISELEADVEDGEIEIEFLERVDYDNPTVTVTKADGTVLETRIEEREGDGIEVRAKGLVRGEEYTVTVTGVALRGIGNYSTVTRNVIAR